MADGNMVGLAKAALTELDAAQLSVAFTPSRVWLVEFSLVQLSTLKVVLTPGPTETQQLGRRSVEAVRDLDVVLAQRMDAADPTNSIDSLVNLYEEILEHYVPGMTLTTAESVLWTMKTPAIPVMPEKAMIAKDHLEDNRCYLAVLRTRWTRRQPAA